MEKMDKETLDNIILKMSYLGSAYFNNDEFENCRVVGKCLNIIMSEKRKETKRNINWKTVQFKK